MHAFDHFESTICASPLGCGKRRAGPHVFSAQQHLTTLPRSSWLIWLETPPHSLSFQLTYGPPDATSLSTIRKD